ncbi:DNA replication ATP-dependent helicase/nuclease DNA2 [Ixodes scapularis]|uniref:DNA replication ATP-dependent helicase/nuclease DNA2 n=1 Tax=Ixodes scapularis TaxID=6945 RepID=UPI001A9CC350|nr:DNA replication ATP-dependent helicase/nuclease DNA2 [Ixodes scapularis]
MKPTKKPAKGQQLLTCFFNRGHGIRDSNWVVPTSSSAADGASIDTGDKAVLAPPPDKNPHVFGRSASSVKECRAAEVKRGGTAEVKDGGEVEGGTIPSLADPAQRLTGPARDASDRGLGAYTSVKRKRDADPEDEKENVRRPPPQRTVREGPCCGEGTDLPDDWDVDDFDVDDFDVDSECLEQRVEPIFRSVKAVVTGLSTGPRLELESADGLRERLTCQLGGTWRTLEVRVGDRVYVHAPFAGRVCVVDDTKGLVVVHPDTLVSTSSVVASLWCPRKSLLAAKFKEAGNRDMLAGTVAHELFQKAVTENASEATMLATLDKLLQRSDLLHQMYALELSEVDVREQLRPLVPRIAQWMRECMATGGPSDRRPAGDQRPVAAVVTRVADIEENHWCPRLGLKGKVDASVEVALHKKPARVPLELKTGRHTFSHDHKAQVVLYSLMMAERQDWDPQEGLLLYLRDGVDMRWVASPHRDRGALVQRRNELAQCLQPGARLPPPIDSERHCPKCPHAVVCSAFRGEPVQGEERPAFVAQSVSHLSPSHRAYLLSWCRMLDEEGYHAGERDLQEHFWLDDACSRESRGLCLSDLSLLHCEAPPGDDARPPVRHVLKRKRGAPGVPARPLPPVGLAAGDRVVLSEQGSLTCVALATGTLAALTESHVELLLDRDTRRSPGWEGKTFRVDRSPSVASAAISYTFLGRLVGTDPRAARLRALLVDRAAPSFRTTLPREVATLCRPALRGLNDTQRRVVLRFLMCDDYLLLRGMPGTGKTTTLAALVHALVLLKKRVLVTSYTHSGVDSILLKLRSRGVPFLRLGPTNRMHPLVRDQSAETLTAALRTTRELEEFYGAQAVVACTCLGSSSLRRQQFDACVVDEASQAPQPSCLGPLFLAERFLLAGDPKQLPPVVQSPKARDMGMDISLFARLETEENTAVLPIQYRMNQAIMDVCNSLAYEGRLECGSAEVSQATLSLPRADLLASLLPRDCWLLEALSPALGRSVVFVCTDGLGWAPEKTPSCNRREAGLSALVLAALLKGGLPEGEVGVVAPFRRQVAVLRALCPPAVEVGTVDQFQGKERAAMLLSCTVARATTSAQDSGGSILDDERRLSVALSRARHKLVLVGSSAAVAGHPPFARLLALLGPNRLIRLRSGDDMGLEGLL